MSVLLGLFTLNDRDLRRVIVLIDDQRKQCKYSRHAIVCLDDKPWGSISDDTAKLQYLPSLITRWGGYDVYGRING